MFKVVNQEYVHQVEWKDHRSNVTDDVGSSVRLDAKDAKIEENTYCSQDDEEVVVFSHEKRVEKKEVDTEYQCNTDDEKEDSKFTNSEWYAKLREVSSNKIEQYHVFRAFPIHYT